MDNKLSVGFAQFNVTDDIQQNIDFGKTEVDKLARREVDLIVLHEMWSSGFDYNILDEAADKTPEIIEELSTYSKNYNLTIIGSLPEKKEGKLYNTAISVGPAGDVINRYNKVHLFPPTKENEYFDAGDSVSIFKLKAFTVGVVICFDIRFPELIRKLACAGANLLVVCAQWPKVRLAQWHTLLKARAIENQMYVVAANCCGIQDGFESLGHSIIINPYGQTIYEAHEYEESVEALIDVKIAEHFKDQFDCLALRKPDAY